MSILSPTIFYIFLERIMCEALDDHEYSVSIGGQDGLLPTSGLQMILLEMQKMKKKLILYRTTTRYKM